MSEPLIVVPLDGSDLSEAALPYASAIAGATAARLLLVSVWEGTGKTLAGELAEDITKLGQEHHEGYLAVVIEKLQPGGLEIESQVLTGNPTEAILRVVQEREPRLLAMATHGRSGLGRWWSGGVASKLVRQAPVSTLIVGPKMLEQKREAVVIHRILVPLDGSQLAESALQPAHELAQSLGADIVLAQALPWAGQAFSFGLPDVNVARIDRNLTEAAEAYLAQVCEALPSQPSVGTRVLHGMPADALIDLVTAESVDLVVMASHTRSGLARAALGSVADRVLQGEAPVLLVRPEAVSDNPGTAPTRRCHTCGRAVPSLEVASDDRCLGCGQHLRVCGNCVYFDGISCLLKRAEVHDTYPGRECPRFQFRETDAGPPGAGGS
jgi:nucleotide-binding universal stress UspA family protein